MNILKHFSCKIYNLYQSKGSASTKKPIQPSSIHQKPCRSSSLGQRVLSAMQQAMSSNNKMTITQRSIAKSHLVSKHKH